MSKTAVNAIVTKIKRRFDYNISDGDLDNLVIDCINDALKEMYQELVNAERYREISNSTTLSTVADQAYIDISSTLVDADLILKLSERENDKPIDLIPYDEFIENWTDPTENTSSIPDEAAIWNDRLYLGATPDSVISIYAEWLGVADDVSAGDTLPYNRKYDPLLVELVVLRLTRWLDSSNATAIAQANDEVDRLTKKLIKYAKKDNVIRQMASRKDGARLGPRKVT